MSQSSRIFHARLARLLGSSMPSPLFVLNSCCRGLQSLIVQRGAPVRLHSPCTADGVSVFFTYLVSGLNFIYLVLGHHFCT